MTATFIESPTHLTNWLNSIKEGDIRYANIPRRRVVSLRSTICGFNNTRGMDRNIFVHLHYCWKKEIAVVVAEAREEVESNKNTAYEYTWRESINKNYR